MPKPWPIMLQFLPIMLLSSAQRSCLLCSMLCSYITTAIMPQFMYLFLITSLQVARLAYLGSSLLYALIFTLYDNVQCSYNYIFELLCSYYAYEKLVPHAFCTNDY